MNSQKSYLTNFLIFITFTMAFAQKDQTQSLDSIILTGTRIEMPFKENSRTITVITAKDIKNSTATNVSDLLQQVAGIDIRRRGINGMQSDLYIRGGSFDQTLLLIDGIKVEDPQTGHHTMNMALPLEVIERIEIIKGPAARIYGQNAFTGAVNIITKSDASKVNSLGVQLGSYEQQNYMATYGDNFGDNAIIAHASRNTSEGYRYNTDFENHNYFLKAGFNKTKVPINVLGFFTERKFGANGFYATPSAMDQYEETQSSLLGVSTIFGNNNLKFTPRLYWKRNQDEYIYIRHNPSVYRNFHQSNKIGAEINGSLMSNLGITGFGVDASKITLSSNNLGDRERNMITMFLEHRFKFFGGKLDITPGLAMTHASDFGSQAFPGLDVGYRLDDHFKLYTNVGYTYRIPTYTDLFYEDPTTIGNENLKPEEAITEELGIKFTTKKLKTYLAIFNRNARNMIDYVKQNEEDLWQPANIQKLNAYGLEVGAETDFKIGAYNQNLNLNYAYLSEELQDLNSLYSKYAINSLKHHITSTWHSQFMKNISETITFKYVKRATGESYSVVDVKANWKIKAFNVAVYANNIFNATYSETNLVPMPKVNILLDLKYYF